ncbi:adventurous gliding motility lipoprotein CglC [Stigmatella aurantiaca]|nr:adventurous gliding motility lipoprotein CglC [Stigmatella aurantiaca]
MSARLAVLLSAALLSSACEITTQLGQECLLIKQDPNNPGESTAILEREILPGQDFISFGVTDCEDLVCVRDANFAADPNPDAQAKGYCSQDCVEGSGKSGCSVTDTSVAENIRNRITCRSLLLDQASLERLRQEDPVAYRRTFGENNSPYFCAVELTP